jgi:hypothetical protein
MKSDFNSDKNNEEYFCVGGNKVSKDLDDEKINELNKIRLINKNIYRDEKNVGSVEFENLWNYERFADAYVRNKVEVGKKYLYSTLTVDRLSVPYYCTNNDEDVTLKEGDVIKIISEDVTYGIDLVSQKKVPTIINYEIQLEDGSTCRLLDSNGLPR